MAKKKKCPECPAGEKWAVPYADFLSLLLALFIALWAISSTSNADSELLKTEFVKIFDFTLTSPLNSDQDDVNDSETENESGAISESSSVTSAEIEQMAEEGGILEQMEMGMSLRLPSNLFFDSGSAEINNSDVFLYLQRMSAIIKKLPDYVKIDVRGYTDNAPLPVGSRYKDNYELSSARSLSVMKNLIKNGISPERISFSGYGEHQAIAPNDSALNRAKNNRVEIFFFVDPKDAPVTQSILEETLQNSQQ
ncbi:flagellar motor protein MotB [Helicobacter sp. MIT 03-1614]|jgi:chemotaxis protein MotB|uniref:Flagellar motor component MotB n=1 Tax=Helicobacter hepaticus (strain ATCC 51449 / 3B1) TaxID=235279 RepID=Q7VIV2_HELHP|nr:MULTISPECIES: flagellar motor protein MotB [Helicobacter]AAP77099.1 flagellar motor component MotB [Helicobacter hepaticus ATCC 51449]TLD89632.1 flagellar motor protein MotB [Helicobacter sp. MIT 03-1614]